MNNKLLYISMLSFLCILLVTSCTASKPPTTLPETVTNEGESANSYLPEIPRISVEELKSKLDSESNILIFHHNSLKVI